MRIKGIITECHRNNKRNSPGSVSSRARGGREESIAVRETVLQNLRQSVGGGGFHARIMHQYDIAAALAEPALHMRENIVLRLGVAVGVTAVDVPVEVGEALLLHALDKA